MELRRHSCVLPSNAPVLLDNTTQDLNRPLRVLQERSGNRQHDFLDTGFSSRRRHIPSSPTENFYSNGLGAYLNSHADLGSPFRQEKSEAEIDRQTAILWRSLQRSEAYQKYRAKQPKDSREQEQKWPEHMEYAFFRGLVRYEPMGRRKIALDGKPRGRNELVADAIQRDTGEARTRKQVSSHIQVLKTLLKDHPNILKHMSKEDLSCRSSRHSLSDAKRMRNRHMMGQSTAPSSKYDNYTQPTQLSWEGYRPLSVPHMLMESPSSRCSNIFKPFDFEMFVRDPHQQPPRHLHTFTKLPKDPELQVTQIDNVRQWHKIYPELAFTSIESYHDCEVIVCDASLQLMTERIPAGAELAIQLEFMSEQNLCSYDSFECRTRFYDSGNLVPQSDDKGNPVDQSSASFSYDPTSRRLDTVPFGSSFWAYRLAGLAKLLREARSGMHSMPGHDVSMQSDREKIEYRVQQNLQRLTAVQEIYARPKSSDKPHCILAIFWRFRQTTSKDSGGQTTWRSILYDRSPPHLRVLPNPPADLKDTKAYHGHELDPSHNPTHNSNTYTPHHLPFGLPPHPYPSQAPFDLNTLSTIALDGAFATYPAPSSLPTDLSPPHALGPPHHPDNDIDFTGGHISICLDPAIEIAAYDTYPSHPNPSHSSVAAGLGDPAHFIDELGVGVHPYVRGGWDYGEWIEGMEGTAGGAAHEDAGGAELWRFGEDAGVGADGVEDVDVDVDVGVVGGGLVKDDGRGEVQGFFLMGEGRGF